MSDVVISVEHVNKLYRLGQVGTGTLSNDLKRWWYQVRGKEDPFTLVGTENDRTKKTDSDFVWVLKDINFEIKTGETLGIIGKNGAGKSTLLKLLSRVTTPTNGIIRAKGRIASLLEVGTGFHPELTGKENIYMNGAILGMTKKEITSKFDEIVEFAGVEKYIDTPVKRYSSGMYVRLAFAVAAFLEPEILIVDEVLAVGDAEFQKRCLGRMKDVSVNDGRTVIFVSHNMTAINSLCTKTILLENGKLRRIGPTHDVIGEYLSAYSATDTQVFYDRDKAPGNETIKILSVVLADINGQNITQSFLEEAVYAEITYESLIEGSRLNLSLLAFTDREEYVFSSPSNTDHVWCGKPHPIGTYKSICKLPANFFNEGRYRIHIIYVNNGTYAGIVENAVCLEKVDSGRNRDSFYDVWGGITRPILEWQTSKIN